MEKGILRYLPMQGWKVQLIGSDDFELYRIDPDFDKTTMIYEKGKKIEGEVKNGFFNPIMRL